MKYFTLEELFIGVALAIAYGFAFSVLKLLLRRSGLFLVRWVELPRLSIFFTKITEKREVERKKRIKLRALGGEVRAAVLTVAFTLGFILLSYYALDGIIRLYMLTLSLLGLLAGDRILCPLGKIQQSTLVKVEIAALPAIQ